MFLPDQPIVPGPNAFAQRLQPRTYPGTRGQINAPEDEETNNPSGPAPYSLSIYSDVPHAQHRPLSRDVYMHSTTESDSTGHAAPVSGGGEERGPPQTLSSSGSRLRDELKDELKLVPSPNPNTEPTPRFVMENRSRRNVQGPNATLQTIQETNPIFSPEGTPEETRSPAPLDLKLAKAHDTSKNSKLKASTSINNFAEAHTDRNDKSANEDTMISKWRLFERIRGPVLSHSSKDRMARKPSYENITTVPRIVVPQKAAQILGTSSRGVTMNKNFSRPTRLPSFGTLPEPNPPYASDGAEALQTGSGNGTPTSSRSYSSRMKRESSDPRLLILNDRIASNVSNSSHELPDTMDDIPPTQPEKSPSQLSRILERISQESSSTAKGLTKETASPQKNTRDMHESGQFLQISDVGSSKRPQMVKSHTGNALSIRGSVHGSLSQEDLQVRSSDHLDNPRDRAKGPRWPLGSGGNTSLTMEDYPAYPEPTPNLQPSPLHISRNRFNHARTTFLKVDTEVGDCSPIPMMLDMRSDRRTTVPKSNVQRTREADSNDMTEPEFCAKYPAGFSDWSEKQHVDDTKPSTRSSSPQQATCSASNRRASKGTPPSVFPNQSWASANSRYSPNPDKSILREILARLDIQRDNLFDFKGHFAENAMATETEIVKLAASVDAQSIEISRLSTQVKLLRDLLLKMQEHNMTPSLIRRDFSHRADNSTRDGSRRAKDRGQTPVSLPNTCEAGNDIHVSPSKVHVSPKPCPASAEVVKSHKKDQENAPEDNPGSKWRNPPGKIFPSPFPPHSPVRSSASRRHKHEKSESSLTQQKRWNRYSKAVPSTHNYHKHIISQSKLFPPGHPESPSEMTATTPSYDSETQDLTDFGTSPTPIPGSKRSNSRASSPRRSIFWESLSKFDIIPKSKR